MRDPFRLALLGLLLSLSPLPAGASTTADDAAIDFTLTAHHGGSFRLRDLRGKVVLVFFGYTRCPDVCPIELQHMAVALRSLADDSGKAQGLFITVDPEHDRPEVLAQYLNYFDAKLLGLTGSRAQIERVAGQFQVNFRKHQQAADRYTMDHTANLFVIDRRGKLHAIVPFGFPATHIETLLRELIAGRE